MESPWRDSADLLGLEIDGTPLADFASNTVSYALEVPSTTTSIVLTPQVTNLFAAYTITANTDSSVEDDTVDLATGDNVITIIVTSADENTTKSYTVTVTRGS